MLGIVDGVGLVTLFGLFNLVSGRTYVSFGLVIWLDGRALPDLGVGVVTGWAYYSPHMAIILFWRRLPPQLLSQVL